MHVTWIHNLLRVSDNSHFLRRGAMLCGTNLQDCCTNLQLKFAGLLQEPTASIFMEKE
jgi:hypothetical protein